MPPIVKDLTAGSTTTLIPADGLDGVNISAVRLVNLGTGVVKWAINTDANANSFHDCIPIASATDAGDGGRVEFDRRSFEKLSVYAVANTRISLIVCYAVEHS